jgi:hypothetical protein
MTPAHLPVAGAMQERELVSLAAMCSGRLHVTMVKLGGCSRAGLQQQTQQLMAGVRQLEITMTTFPLYGAQIQLALLPNVARYECRQHGQLSAPQMVWQTQGLRCPCVHCKAMEVVDS